MDESDFEGTLVLEKLAEVGAVEAFFEAIDEDDLGAARSLMKMAKVDRETIDGVMKQIEEASAGS